MINWLGWAGLACAMVATLCKANTKRIGWIAGMLGNICFLAAYWPDRCLVATNIVFFVLYIYGWLKWSDFSFGYIVAWYDGWVGYYWDRKNRWLYLLPIPMVGLIVKFPPKRLADEGS